MSPPISVPSVSVTYAGDGRSTRSNDCGMRPMQERAYQKRGEQYLLIKSPPVSGKSRALMFIALDKLHYQNLKQALIVVPERSIGASFNDEPLTKYGFWEDWKVEPKWNLCDAPLSDSGKVDAVKKFLESDDKALVCTHATFRFAVERFGIDAFDERLIAVDEFHHVSANPDNRLGEHVRKLMSRDKAHLLAMTGSYFRGDAEAVLHPEDEAKFETVTYTYYEQLNGYEHLKQLDIGYFFYSGSYLDELHQVLDPNLKTIVHIPNVNSRESTGRGKDTEVSEIIGMLGTWMEKDPKTGFDLVKGPDGKILKVADLVDDGPDRHAKVLTALRDSSQKNNRDHVDIIIALGMAKEGFDWIWCEHALTIGYRASLTEIVQIIGRATRDAPGKPSARFTNLIVEPDASEETVSQAVNDTLKAIAASLLMEQVLAPRFDFKPKNPGSGPTQGFDYGPAGYDPSKCNVGVDHKTGTIQMEIKGLTEPKSDDAKRICREDLNELVTSFVQDKECLEKGIFDQENLIPEELTQVKMGRIVKEKFPHLDDEDQEAVRQHAVAAMNVIQQAKLSLDPGNDDEEGRDAEPGKNTALIEGVKRFMNVRDLDIDLIDKINPFSEAYAILAKTMNPERLKQVIAAIAAKKANFTPEEAKDLAIRAWKFKKERDRLPSIDAMDPWEKRMAQGAAAFVKFKDQNKYA